MTSIRPAQPKDAKAIAQVYVDTWRSTYAGLLPDPILVKMSLEHQRVSWSRTLAAGKQVVVLEHNGGVVGFGSCGRNRLRRLDYTGEIFTLYVLPDLHGRGLGRQLIGGLFDALIGGDHDSALLWVLATNPSRFFYEAMGGRRIAERDERMRGHRLYEIAYGWRPLAPHFSPQ
jgi:ribosomal protein S18 acetylase RimI-like enzyme